MSQDFDLHEYNDRIDAHRAEKAAEYKLLGVISDFLRGYQVSPDAGAPAGYCKKWNNGIGTAAAQLDDPQENKDVLDALEDYWNEKLAATKA